MKTLKKLTLMLAVMLLASLASYGQSKWYKKVQKSVEYEQYDRKWYKEAKATLKAAKRDTKASVRASKSGRKQADKLNKMREQIATLNGKKEGGDE